MKWNEGKEHVLRKTSEVNRAHFLSRKNSIGSLIMHPTLFYVFFGLTLLSAVWTLMRKNGDKPNIPFIFWRLSCFHLTDLGLCLFFAYNTDQKVNKSISSAKEDEHSKQTYYNHTENIPVYVFRIFILFLFTYYYIKHTYYYMLCVYYICVFYWRTQHYYSWWNIIFKL